MDPSKRVVMFPLTELFDEKGPIAAVQGDALDETAVRKLLGAPGLRIAVAIGACPLRWIAGDDRLELWKAEVRPRFTASDRVYREDFPGGYFYRATLWKSEDGDIVVFELHD
jgi:hypothetical protein